MIKTLYSVAGFDPSGGAGVLLDLAVFRSLGFRGAAVLTALTAQDSASVFAVRPVPPAFIRRQWDALRADLPPAGIKIGMAGSPAGLAEIARGLALHPSIPRVVDPILRATSGALLAGRISRARFTAALSGRLTLLTPNLAEASWLTGHPVATPEAMEEAARSLAEDWSCACLIKGGHLPGAAIDVLFDGSRVRRFPHPRLNRNAHGTGCFLSASILAHLALGRELAEACAEAICETGRAIRRSVRPGRGRSLLAP
ncbi:MAG: hydroxymethylpyrimidine/phosphomethylpyrimidine kinase [Candidatus Aminicenantes bacterium]|nr:hydroxymethylpyrimidine/phosphomethylpyrimidine kinase [Candidatus Aminicenantes bacterium]